MRDRDCLHRFLFEHYPIRGHIVHLDASWRALLEHREYPAAVRDALGEAVAASVLLAATLKFDGTLSLQLQGRGPMHLLLAQCSGRLGVRALARHAHDLSDAAGEDSVGEGEAASASEMPVGAAARILDNAFSGTGPEPWAKRRNLAVLAGDGTLTVTLETDDAGQGVQRYQGVVPLTGRCLADCLQGYFENSEQLPTRLWLHATQAGAAGLLLQRVGQDAATAPFGAIRRSADLDPLEIEDAWRRAQLLGDTLKPEELHDLSSRELLRRLFAEDDLRLFEPSPVFFRCRCSHDRVAGMLRALGAEEVRSVLAEQGQVEVCCDFCNRAYRFDAVDVERLFAAGPSPAGGETLH
ncbi:hypothetical protein ACG33_06405 [Steroidobacter denitrificans]|uniref:33 kDa chaperonin n=1 Tax=Steroidobacter denitrificans TaxID=465721 RepID=A0A127F8G9_STEDE|nr:Hsp33 family molecular chaperone HslO [Steroidobacter denitrificans]AMN46733.1 hypothetical protein ACG33_06405 [Steroidobacter denitrificans]